MQGQLSYNIWLSLPPEVKHKLVTLFDMPRSGRTVVEYRSSGAVVTSDGYTAIDLQSISLDRMQGLLGTESDNFYKLFEIVIANLDALLAGTYYDVVVVEPIVEIIAVPIVESVMSPLGEVKPRFCDSCDSKGGRHKKVCPKYA